MLYKITNWLTKKVMYEVEAETFLEAVEKQVQVGADLSSADFSYADFSYARLPAADLSYTNFSNANLSNGDLSGADLSGATLFRANLSNGDLSSADLSGATLFRANLSGADLSGADLSGAKNLTKIMGVEPGNYYWKRFGTGFCNNDYQFGIGLNALRDGEVFAGDERIACSYPGFHFASRSWCASTHPYRPLEGRIRIPKDAQINEPWATDGKASADRIEIIQVFDVATGRDMTNEYRKVAKKEGTKWTR